MTVTFLRPFVTFLTLIGLAIVPCLSRADAPPSSRSVLVLEGALQGVQLTVSEGGGHWRLHIATASGRTEHQLSTAGAPDVAARAIEVAAGVHVAVVDVHHGSVRETILVGFRNGRPRVVWAGRIDLEGDPGEREGFVLDATDRTGDGHADVVVARVRESHRDCERQLLWLEPQALDPARMELRAVELLRADVSRAEALTRAEPDAAELAGRVRSGLRATAATSRRGGDDAPRELTDGDPATSWAEQRGGAGRGELAVLQWSETASIRGFTFALPLAGRGGAVAPSAVWVLGPGGRTLRADLRGAAAGARLSFRLPEPVEWSCFAVMLDAPEHGRQHTGLSEVEVELATASTSSLESAVAALVAGGADPADAVGALRGAGQAGADAIAAAWQRLPSRSKRHVVRLLRDAASTPLVLGALAQAAQDDEADTRRIALDAVARAGGAGHAALAQLMASSNADTSGGAALRLGRMAPLVALETVERQLRASEAPLGPLTLAALARGLAGQPGAGEDWTPVFERWASDAAVVPERLALALDALAPSIAQASVSALVRRLATADASFEVQFRVVRAAVFAPADPAVDAWLAALVGSSEFWMLRAAALRTLARPGHASAHGLVAGALGDPYPRVRLAAVEVLARSTPTGDLLVRLARVARRDPWPMVRAAATPALAASPRYGRVLRAALGDRSRLVRAAAIEALTPSRDRETRATVRAMLADDSEWAEVRQAALAFVDRACDRDAADVLVRIVRRGIRAASEQDVQLAPDALTALRRLAPTEAEALTAPARASTPALRAATTAPLDPPACP